MESCVNLHSQLTSIMEVLANAAVAEICQLVEDGFASLRLEISRSQRENVALKSRLRLMAVRAGELSHREPVPPVVVTCTRTDHHFGEDDPTITKRNIKFTTLENTDSKWSQLVDVTEELTGCSVLEHHHTADNSSIGPQYVSPTADSDRPLCAGAEIPSVSVSGSFEKQDFAILEEKEGAGETSTLSQCSHPAKQSHRDAVDPRNSVSAGSGRSKASEVDTPLIKPLESELPLTKSEVKGLCGAAADWRAEAVSAPVKLEAEASWSEDFRTLNASVSECVNNSRLTNTESEAGELDTNSLDLTSFDDLSSSLEVVRSLTAPHKCSTGRDTGTEESLSSSSFAFLSNSLTVSSFISASSDSNSRSSPSSTERVFSCQQCSCLLSTYRDLMVHQRSHTGERIYHCHLCKKPFIHPHQLKTHQRVHTGEKPFSCAQCGKCFSQSSHIKRHMSVHTGEKRYSCSLCGKRFSQACSLKVHQAVHTGERPYSCTKCGKSFSVLGNLVRHQSVHISK